MLVGLAVTELVALVAVRRGHLEQCKRLFPPQCLEQAAVLYK